MVSLDKLRYFMLNYTYDIALLLDFIECVPVFQPFT